MLAGARLLALVAGLALAACSSGEQIQRTPSKHGRTAKPKDKDKQKDDGQDRTDEHSADAEAEESSNGELQVATGDEKGEGDLVAAELHDDQEIEYPAFHYNGRGVSTCDGDNLTITTNLQTAMTREVLEVQRLNTYVHCDGRCGDEANKPENLAKANVHNVFAKPTKDEMHQLKDAGFDFASYGIFAKASTRRNDGLAWTFSQPVPVFPWPAPTVRYDALSAGPKTWSTVATAGGRQLHVTVQVEKTAQQGDVVTLKFTTTIAEGNDDWTLYEAFPLPREATYIIDAKAKTIAGFHSVGLRDGGKHCDDKESSAVDFKLCDRIKGGKTDNFGCVYGQN